MNSNFLELIAFSGFQIFSCIYETIGEDCELCGSPTDAEAAQFATVNCNYSRKATDIKIVKPEEEVFESKSQICGLLVFGS